MYVHIKKNLLFFLSNAMFSIRFYKLSDTFVKQTPLKLSNIVIQREKIYVCVNTKKLSIYHHIFVNKRLEKIYK